MTTRSSYLSQLRTELDSAEAALSSVLRGQPAEPADEAALVGALVRVASAHARLADSLTSEAAITAATNGQLLDEVGYDVVHAALARWRDFHDTSLTDDPAITRLPDPAAVLEVVAKAKIVAFYGFHFGPAGADAVTELFAAIDDGAPGRITLARAKVDALLGGYGVTEGRIVPPVHGSN